ncbi:hypothetical protein GCK72_022107 [Caenorhabditis remanei]|uniref:Uncharacterized protein n=1 Tax=Caenorhabditis remanei TaxID=31234 RepID=A0A6A5FSV4_CAERE|nr:hypothetical protein GCK72_022107 [Caenorhabditis remanei]KAF1745660.1 hypothetical protein GCK72_022107 [Caenorhabditis remanei]
MVPIFERDLTGEIPIPFTTHKTILVYSKLKVIGLQIEPSTVSPNGIVKKSFEAGDSHESSRQFESL